LVKSVKLNSKEDEKLKDYTFRYKLNLESEKTPVFHHRLAELVRVILENLLDLVRCNRADGVLYLHLKFSESQDYDLPDLKREIHREGIPMYVLDTEYQTTHLAQTKTRIQAFAESLRGGRL